ncbi:MAG: TIGR02117 family protein [Pseudomonadota bacterium]
MRARTVRIAKWLAISLISAVIAFLLVAWAGSSIPRNASWEEPDTSAAETVTILVGHNGIHTEIIMPIANETIDWRGVFPLGDIATPDRAYSHVGVSWGERSFFLETSTWSDLNLFTAVRALAGGEGLLHAAYYVRPAPSYDFRELRIRRDEYRELAAIISAQLAPENARTTYPGYASHDVFYSALGTYHLGNTCNQWTSDQLARAGIGTGLWTPLPGGVMKWVPDFEGR